MFFTLFKKRGVKPLLKKTAEFAKAYGNGIKSANILYQTFKRKGGGGTGVLNNVKKLQDW